MTRGERVAGADARRHDFLDELRGFALLGIVLVNAPQLAVSAYGWTDAAVAAPWDRAAAWLVAAFAQAKFYPLFAFLFGCSARLAMDPSRVDGPARFARRLAVLAVLGGLHAAFFYAGDILIFYASVGLSLLWLRRADGPVASEPPASHRRARRLFMVAATVWMLVMAATIALTHATRDLQPLPGADAIQAGIAALGLDAATLGGRFLDAVGPRLRFWREGVSSFVLFNATQIAALFALGWRVAASDALAHPARHARFWRRATAIGFAIGLPVACLGAWWQIGPQVAPSRAGAAEFVGFLVITLAGPWLTLAYVGALALRRIRRGAAGAAWLRPAGRMSLSVYLGESVLLSMVFGAWGLGLFGRLGALGVVFVAASIGFALVLAARFAWRRGLRRGPMETLVARLVR